eukprot:GHVR01151856.1.p1 GENE.GHVR01151856.1~~GHVR01151856.1.p1  ORF type:complete len:102 (+),score=0.62 GHVR01151856.1:179-484(+)
MLSFSQLIDSLLNSRLSFSSFILSLILPKLRCRLKMHSIRASSSLVSIPPETPLPFFSPVPSLPGLLKPPNIECIPPDISLEPRTAKSDIDISAFINSVIF